MIFSFWSWWKDCNSLQGSFLTASCLSSYKSIQSQDFIEKKLSLKTKETMTSHTCADSSLQNGILFLANSFKKLGSYVYIPTFFKVDLLTKEQEKFKKLVLNKLRKNVSGLQDGLPEFGFGIHLISIQWGKITKILRWTFLFLQYKSKISPSLFLNHGNLWSSLSPFLKTYLLRLYCSLGNLFNKMSKWPTFIKFPQMRK